MGHGDNIPNAGLDLCEDAGHTVQGGLDGSSPSEFLSHSLSAYCFSGHTEINTWPAHEGVHKLATSLYKVE